VLEGFDATGEPMLRPARQRITLRHLLTHTAGFVYDIWNPDMSRYMEKKGAPGKNAALMLPLVFDPGDRWDYGINIDWAGKAVERASGQSLGDFFAEQHLPAGRDDGHWLHSCPGPSCAACRHACTRRGRDSRPHSLRAPTRP